MTRSEQDLFPFEPFAQNPEYVEVNRSFVNRTLNVIPKSTVLDVACGTGLVSRLVRDRFSGVEAIIVGIDPNFRSITDAQDNIRLVGKTLTMFLEMEAKNLADLAPQEGFDYIYFLNAIHELPTVNEKIRVLSEIANVLKSKTGRLMINSAFTQEAYLEAFAKYWGLWKLHAVKNLGGKRNKEKKPFALLSTQTYTRLLEEAGLQVVSVETTQVDLRKKSLIAISRYLGFIEGVFMDVDLPEETTTQQKSDALIKALDKVEQAYAKKYESPLVLPRNWVEFVAVKPQ